MTTHSVTTDSAELDLLLRRATAARTVLAGQSPRERYAQLTLIADRLDEAAEELIPVAMAESHLPEARLRGELRRTTLQLRMFAEEAAAGKFLDARIDIADPDFGTGPRPDIRRMKRPIGVVLNFAASNFPFAFSVAGGDTASALATGCPVLVKAHEGHPRLSEATARIVTAALVDSGAPDGAFAIIQGRDAGIEALRDDRVDAATFTGSVRVGLLLADIAAKRPRPIPFYGELGSINPVVVTAAAVAARGPEIARGLVDSFTLGNGQFCTKPGLVFLPTGSDLDAELVSRVGAVRTGRLLTESIGAGFAERTNALRDEFPGGMLVEPGEQDGCPRPGLLKVDFETFTAHADTLLTEAFGPFTVVVEYTDAKQLTHAAELLEGSLTITLHAETGDGELVRELLPVLEAKAGRLILDDWPTGVSVTPAQHHGGPYPSTTSPLHTAVGTAAVERFLRPVAYQNFHDAWLPEPLQDANPWNIPRQNGEAGRSQRWGRAPSQP